MGNVDTVENEIQNAVLATANSFITPRIELPFQSMNAWSGWVAASVMVSFESEE